MLEQESAAREAAELSWGAFKPRLAEAISAHLDPIQQRYHLITEESTVLDQVTRHPIPSWVSSAPGLVILRS